MIFKIFLEILSFNILLGAVNLGILNWIRQQFKKNIKDIKQKKAYRELLKAKNGSIVILKDPYALI